jgi:hypothetical protein
VDFTKRCDASQLDLRRIIPRLGSKSVIGELCHWSHAASTTHRESYGGAGPGVAQPVLRVPVARGRWLPRTQCRQEQRSITDVVKTFTALYTAYEARYQNWTEHADWFKSQNL